MWFARFSSLDRSSPGGFWDLGIGATLGGFGPLDLGRFFGVIFGGGRTCFAEREDSGM